MSALEHLCRLCALETVQMVNIFQNSGLQLQLAHKIETHIHIKIEDDGVLPQSVCIPCISKLNICHNFFESSHAANAKLVDMTIRQDSSEQLQEAVCNDELSTFEDAEHFEPPELMANEEIRQVAVVMAQKNEQRRGGGKPILNLLVVNLDEGETDSERISTALQQFAQQASGEDVKEADSFGCFSCKLLLPCRTDFVAHFQQMHPQQVRDCQQCGEKVCGSEEVYSRHLSVHEGGVVENFYNMMSVRSEVKENFVTKPRKWELLRLGEYKTNLKGAQREKQILKFETIIARSKSIHPGSKNKVVQSLKSFHEKFQWIPKKTTSCLHCAKVFGNKRSVYSHIQKKHSGGEILDCVICDEAYRKTAQPQPHMKPAVFRCKECNVEFADAEQLKCHRTAFHMFSCDRCKRSLFKSKAALLSHIQKQHVRYFVCYGCKKPYKNKSSLRGHIKEHHLLKKGEFVMTKHYKTKEEESILCYECGKMFKSKGALTRHIRCVHLAASSQGSFLCQECGKIFTSKVSLKNHKYGVHAVRVKCEICDKEVYKHALKRHTKTHLKEPEYPCKYCGKRLTTIFCLKIHEARHEGVKASKCDVCGVTCKTPRLMELHRAKHALEEEIYIPPHLRPVQCPVCSKTFRDKYHLKPHLKAHETGKYETRVYNHCCSLCDRKFSAPENLEYHIKSCHHAEAPNLQVPEPRPVDLTCEICKRTFYTEKSKEIHFNAQHRKEKHFSCPLCDKKFFYSAGMYKHLHNIHKVAKGKPYKTLDLNNRTD